jgi:SAM-dependent methyltransferase
MKAPDPTGPQKLDEEERLMRAFVELRGQSIDSSLDSLRAYDDLHDTGSLRQRDSFYIWLVDLLNPRPGQTLLDVSCGQGTLLHFASKAGLRATGLDLSPLAAAIASRQIRPGTVSVADAERLPYASDSFDHVTNIGSLEHYFAPAQAVREMARVLRPDGRALILLPNTFGLLGNIAHVWRTGEVFDDRQPLQRYGTNGQWRRLLERNGLSIAHTFKYERAWPRTPQDLAWYALHPHRLVRTALSLAIPTNLSSFLVYLCSNAC